ncbi:hypothetical protein [Marinoscillum sp. MHG1-6]|uniref:hypothetical protein n=1 Tax=Marinoscillum sp. MHG1-6 TaxID=2959627 RepID=UPI002157B74F|nr:hypothetical protein [Marinoscillum sp. MHG1-6]
MQSSKPRVIKDFEKLDPTTQEQIKLAFPFGFHDKLIHFTDREGKRVTALPFETDEKYYLVRMTREEARAIVEDDEDYDEDGMLKESVKDDYEDKYGDLNHMADYLSDGEDDDDDGDDDY